MRIKKIFFHISFAESGVIYSNLWDSSQKPVVKFRKFVFLGGKSDKFRKFRGRKKFLKNWLTWENVKIVRRIGGHSEKVRINESILEEKP